jgi:hypothetical protein
MDEARMTRFLRRRAEYCRRLAMMQRDPSIAEELRALARRYEDEASRAARVLLLGLPAS